MKNQAALILKILTVLANFWQRLYPWLDQKSNLAQPLGFPQQAYTLASIDLKSLRLAGIEGIILDLDNTIISEDDRYISPGAEIWIAQAKKSGIQFFILSNGKRQHRVRKWSNRLGIRAINPAKKPLPFAFYKALSSMQLPPPKVVVIGDGRHTDILGAWLVGCSSIQVATLPHPWRWWEKILGRRVQTPYPTTYELWPLDDGYKH